MARMTWRQRLKRWIRLHEPIDGVDVAAIIVFGFFVYWLVMCFGGIIIDLFN